MGTAAATGAVDGRYIAFFVSALGVVMDTTERRQFFFVGHDAEVSSMALHPARSLLATGQVTSHGSQLPPIFVWSPSVVVANQEDPTVQAAITALKEAMNGKAPPGYVQQKEDEEKEAAKQHVRRQGKARRKG